MLQRKNSIRVQDETGRNMVLREIWSLFGIRAWGLDVGNLFDFSNENKNDHLTGLLPGVMRWHMWKHFEK